MIPFNKPYLTGKETEYIRQAVATGHLSGNGEFTKRCQRYFEDRYGFGKCLLTTSCTDALEMAALLCNIEQGDEVIVPSYTFVSSALAFVRQGATIVFADSCADNPNIDADSLEALITPRTKAIVPVHYAGVACDMDRIMEIAHHHNIYVVEDAAQAIDSRYKGRPLGSVGDIATFSFHETKNLISGEGGMIVINNQRLVRRAEILWEKGTNRAEFFRGEVNKYGWVDLGSSFLPSEVVSAFLWAQIEHLDDIQQRRRTLWARYLEGLHSLEEQGLVLLPNIPHYATNNAHIFYLVCHSLEERSALIAHLKQNGYLSVFHYLSLHKSTFYEQKHDGRNLPHCDRYADCLVRLPLFYELAEDDVDRIVCSIKQFYTK